MDRTSTGDENLRVIERNPTESSLDPVRNVNSTNKKSLFKKWREEGAAKSNKYDRRPHKLLNNKQEDVAPPEVVDSKNTIECFETTDFEFAKLEWAGPEIFTTAQFDSIPVRFDFEGLGRIRVKDFENLKQVEALNPVIISNGKVCISETNNTLTFPCLATELFDNDRRLLRHHGGEDCNDGYNIDDLGNLLRSTNSAQVLIALRIIKNIFRHSKLLRDHDCRAGYGLGRKFHSYFVEQLSLVLKYPPASILSIIYNNSNKIKGPLKFSIMEMVWDTFSAITSGSCYDEMSSTLSPRFGSIVYQNDAQDDEFLVALHPNEDRIVSSSTLISVRKATIVRDSSPELAGLFLVLVNPDSLKILDGSGSNRDLNMVSTTILDEFEKSLDLSSWLLSSKSNADSYFDDTDKVLQNMINAKETSEGDKMVKRLGEKILLKTSPLWWDTPLLPIMKFSMSDESKPGFMDISQMNSENLPIFLTHSFAAWKAIQSSAKIISSLAAKGKWNVLKALLPPKVLSTFSTLHPSFSSNVFVSKTTNDLDWLSLKRLNAPDNDITRKVQAKLMSSIYSGDEDALSFYLHSISSFNGPYRSSDKVLTPRLCPDYVSNGPYLNVLVLLDIKDKFMESDIFWKVLQKSIDSCVCVGGGLEFCNFFNTLSIDYIKKISNPAAYAAYVSSIRKIFSPQICPDLQQCQTNTEECKCTYKYYHDEDLHADDHGEENGLLSTFCVDTKDDFFLKFDSDLEYRLQVIFDSFYQCFDKTDIGYDDGLLLMQELINAGVFDNPEDYPVLETDCVVNLTKSLKEKLLILQSSKVIFKEVSLLIKQLELLDICSDLSNEFIKGFQYSRILCNIKGFITGLLHKFSFQKIPSRFTVSVPFLNDLFEDLIIPIYDLTSRKDNLYLLLTGCLFSTDTIQIKQWITRLVEKLYQQKFETNEIEGKNETIAYILAVISAVNGLYLPGHSFELSIENEFLMIRKKQKEMIHERAPRVWYDDFNNLIGPSGYVSTPKRFCPIQIGFHDILKYSYHGEKKLTSYPILSSLLQSILSYKNEKDVINYEMIQKILPITECICELLKDINVTIRGAEKNIDHTNLIFGDLLDIKRFKLFVGRLPCTVVCEDWNLSNSSNYHLTPKEIHHFLTVESYTNILQTLELCASTLIFLPNVNLASKSRLEEKKELPSCGTN